MRYLKYILVGYLFILLSCYDDKGNYNYDWQPDLYIEFSTRDTIAVMRGTNLNVDVEVFAFVKEGDEYNPVDFNEELYTFKWLAFSTYSNETVPDTLSFEKDLNLPIYLDILTGYYRVEYTITEKETSIEHRRILYLQVVDRFQSGILFLTEDDRQVVDLEIYGKEIDGTSVLDKGVLERSGFPYRNNGANSILYHSTSNRVYIATGEATGWLSTKNFTWNDKQMINIIMSEYQPLSYTFKNIMLSNHYSLVYYFSESGNGYFSNTNFIVYPRFNNLPPSVTGKEFYENVEVSPYVIGWTNQIVFDNTNKRTLEYLGSNSGPQSNLIRLADDITVSNIDLLHMQDYSLFNSKVIGKDLTSGQYLSYTYTYAGTLSLSSTTLNNTDGLFDKAEHIVLDENGFMYVSVGSKLYVYREGGGIDALIEVDLGIPEAQITCMQMFSTYQNRYANGFFIATYSESTGGNVYFIQAKSTDPEDLTIVERISGTGKVKSISYW